MSDGVPAYRRVADELRAQIERGDLAEGDRLPPHRILAATYGVTPGIVRYAIDLLRADGLVVARQGSGVYVRRFQRITRRSPARLSADQWGSGQAIQDHDTAPRPRTLGVVVGDVPAPDFVASGLGVDPGTPVLSRSRRFVVDGFPVQLAVSYLPVELTRGTRIEHTDTGPGGLYARLAEGGHAPTRFVEHLVCRAPSPDERSALDLPGVDGQRVLEITRYAYSDIRCVEVNRMILNPDRYGLVYEFPA